MPRYRNDSGFDIGCLYYPIIIFCLVAACGKKNVELAEDIDLKQYFTSTSSHQSIDQDNEDIKIVVPPDLVNETHGKVEGHNQYPIGDPMDWDDEDWSSDNPAPKKKKKKEAPKDVEEGTPFSEIFKDVQPKKQWPIEYEYETCSFCDGKGEFQSSEIYIESVTPCSKCGKTKDHSHPITISCMHCIGGKVAKIKQ